MRNFLSLTILVSEFFHFASLGVSCKPVILVLVHLADAAISPVLLQLLFYFLFSYNWVNRPCCSKRRSCLTQLGSASQRVIFLRSTLKLQIQFVSLRGTSVITSVIIPRIIVFGAPQLNIMSIILVFPVVPLPLQSSSLLYPLLYILLLLFNPGVIASVIVCCVSHHSNPGLHNDNDVCLQSYHHRFQVDSHPGCLDVL